MSPWKVVEHTADVGLEATGSTLEDALEALVEGFGALVCPDGEVRSSRTRTLTVEAEDLDDLVVDLLDELNYVHQVDHFVPVGADVQLQPSPHPRRLQAEVHGEAYDPDRHGHLMEIKATTYHGLEASGDPPRIQVLFDV